MAKEVQEDHARDALGFNREGNLIQVEYAVNAVQRGGAVVAMAAEDRKKIVIVCVKSNSGGRLEITNSVQKIITINGHFVAWAGHKGDANELIEEMVIQSLNNMSVYGEKINIEVAAKKIARYMHSFTRYNGTRPLGAALFIAGADEENLRLFKIVPDGNYTEWIAAAIGNESKEIMNILDMYYEPYISTDDAIMMSLNAIVKTHNGQKKYDLPVDFDIGILSLEENKILKSEEISKYIDNLIK